MLTDYMVTCPNPRCHWSGSLLPYQNRDAWTSPCPPPRSSSSAAPSAAASGAHHLVGDELVRHHEELVGSSAERPRFVEARRRRRAFSHSSAVSHCSHRKHAFPGSATVRLSRSAALLIECPRRIDPAHHDTQRGRGVSIDVEDYSKVYGETAAVSARHLLRAPGEILGLVGPNGAGKTTTLRALAGILQPTTGRLSIAGHDIVREPIAAKAQLAYVPDDPHLFDRLTVWEHFRFTAAAYRLHDWQDLAEKLLVPPGTGREARRPGVGAVARHAAEDGRRLRLPAPAARRCCWTSR